MPKQKIPEAVRDSVWNYWVGSDKAQDACFCCSQNIIQRGTYQCGHIQSEKLGGEVNLQNLRPVCQKCNTSMGTKNMVEFMKTYGYPIRKDFNIMKTAAAAAKAPLMKAPPRPGIDIQKLSMAELKEMCTFYGVKKGGLKKDVVERLKKYSHNKYFKSTIKTIPLPDLKQICRDYDLKVTGAKADLVKRIIDADVVIELNEYLQQDVNDPVQTTQNDDERTWADKSEKILRSIIPPRLMSQIEIQVKALADQVTTTSDSTHITEGLYENWVKRFSDVGEDPVIAASKACNILEYALAKLMDAKFDAYAKEASEIDNKIVATVDQPIPADTQPISAEPKP